MNKRPITRICIDCKSVLKNRSKKTLRCRECNLKNKSLNKTGRKTGICLTCGTKLSTKNNKTGKCKKCFHTDIIPWNKGVTGFVPWNKGKSIFNSKEEYRIHANKKRKELRENEDTIKKFPDRIRTLIRNSIKIKTKNFYRKNTKTEILLGCTIKFYIEYIESKFTNGMTWNNYGNKENQWNIDHIIPISKFDLTDIDEQKKAFNYKNTQPLWAKDNFKKGNNIL